MMNIKCTILRMRNVFTWSWLDCRYCRVVNLRLWSSHWLTSTGRTYKRKYIYNNLVRFESMDECAKLFIAMITTLKTNINSVIFNWIRSWLLLLTHNLVVARRPRCTSDCCTDHRTLISQVVQGTHALDTCAQAVLRVIQRRFQTNCM